ncbi:TetR/AcrR family transcriptional regulator [Aliiroseovarius lamellibrachiae]|uniref:TetR/AcrR family transcriptional regulator n=1 Tax=Aliiroseovarius lamellibrachiae TaxID=1924933 RepID=UPI001BE0664B|nr:TetR/AcrR family transcriptional regulator [Aliiroseovarius lamellibrachiae]MBT2131001.1 TetR/AcrR family transcriptional regulator [Aliiroseovarius lamellibrachiae]
MKRDQRLVQSETAIVEAALKTLITNPSAAMSEIAIAADVGRATLYRHFETREVLIKALVVDCMKETEIALKGIEHLKGRAAFEAIFDLLMPLADRYQFMAGIWSQVQNDKDLVKIEAGWKKDMQALVKQTKKRGEINRDIPSEWIVAVFDSTFAAAWVLVSSGDLSPSDAARYAKQTFFSGCAG